MAIVSIGDKITCTNGHLIGTATASVGRGEADWFKKFKWTERTPALFTPPHLVKCLECGADFMRPLGQPERQFGWEMHFEDGSWR